MNVFSLAFAEVLRTSNTLPIRNIFTAAAISITGRKCIPLMDTRLSDVAVLSKQIEPFTESSGGTVCETITRLVRDGLIDAIDIRTYPKAEVEVFTRLGTREQGWDGVVDSDKPMTMAAEAKFTNGDDVVFWHRFAIVVGIEEHPPLEGMPDALEWEVLPFPTPDTHPDSSMVIITREQMVKMSTGVESIRDFGCMAIKAGWNIVQVRANDLVLIK